MSHSNSSLNTFANCMAKFYHSYILRTPIKRKISPHLIFGSMAHEVLDKAGKLRDDVNDGIVTKDDYYYVIPSEVLYPELKEEFGIDNWEKYFIDVIKQVAEYEFELVSELKDFVTIEREVKLQITVEQLEALGIYNIKQPIVGVIDFLAHTATHATIIDYKFSTTRKGQDDFDMNSQLPLYAMMVHYLYDIPLHNIKYGYIDIPKKSFDKPALLTNGTLSRAKGQNVSQDMYKACVTAIHGDDPKYNCEPGGYYYDIYCNLALNKAAYLNTRWLDIDSVTGITNDLFEAAKMIDYMLEHNMTFIKKYDAYSCKSCEYLEVCKPWLGGEFQ